MKISTRSRPRSELLRSAALGAVFLIPGSLGGILPTVGSPGCSPPVTQPSGPTATVSDEAIRLTNDQRAAAGLSSLSTDSILNSAASAHSVDQANQDLLTHTGSDGSSAGDRIRAAGGSAGTWGENVGGGYADASSVVTGWMNSSGHRANILNPSYTEIGVAEATAADGTRYWTMVLAA